MKADYVHKDSLTSTNYDIFIKGQSTKESILKDTEDYGRTQFVDEIYKLQQENEELKKQLEHCFCNRTDCASRIKDSNRYDSLEQKIEKQQQEFIKYLEDINSFETIGNILNKYKEIIGENKDD